VVALLRAATAVGLPLKLLDAVASGDNSHYRHRLVLIRPDQHIAWRSDTIPTDVHALIDVIRGAARQIDRSSSEAPYLPPSQ
jgi:hypothetical protein